jgi:hypothetical protein
MLHASTVDDDVLAYIQRVRTCAYINRTCVRQPLSRTERIAALAEYEYDDLYEFSDLALLSSELSSADWRALWHVAFGERDALPSARCFGSPVNASAAHAHDMSHDDAGEPLEELSYYDYRPFDVSTCPNAREFMSSVDQRHAMPSDARHTLVSGARRCRACTFLVHVCLCACAWHVTLM